MDKVKNKKLFHLFLKNPGRIGSVAASSPFLAREITKKIDLSSAKCVVELGSGTGTITKKILEKLSPDCLFLCFEIEPDFVKELEKKINDPRVKIICDSAENIDIYLKKYRFEKADYIISGLPLASLPTKTSRSILRNVYAYLATGGQYIQFQYSLSSLRQIKYFFSSVAVSFVFFNFPPAFVYVCVKG
ncbi:MAG: methyltransferase domain-containing protein [Patescibacteria group bacterium]|nr:methyltransferase domain-containing protein [Patescibacteria group bacterium]